MNEEQQQLAKLIRDIQAHGDVGVDALARALTAQGVRVAAAPTTIDTTWQTQRIEQMLHYAASTIAGGPFSVNEAYRQASPETKQSYLSALHSGLQHNPYFYLGMQTTGEMVRAVVAAPDLSAAYNHMPPEERAAWVSSLRSAWHAFSQAAAAFDLQQSP